MKTTSPKSHVDCRLAAYAALATAALAAPALPEANAQIVYSGVRNINVPATTAGIYINMVTGAFGTAAATTGWDINPWATGTGAAAAWRFFPNANGTNPDGGVVVSAGTAVLSLALGTLVGPASTFGIGSANVPPSGTSFFGIRLFNEATSTTHFGWVQVLLPANSGTGLTPGTVIDWAFESAPNTGIAVGAVPEPSTYALFGVVAAGAMGLRAWRRRKAA
jgi:hypothetical protein